MTGRDVTISRLPQTGRSAARTNFRGTIESRHEIGRNVVLRRVRSRAQVAELQQRLLFVDLERAAIDVSRTRFGDGHTSTHQDVIGLDVRVHDVALAEQAQGEEELMSVCPDRADVQTDVFTESLHHLTEVHTGQSQL